MRRLINKLLSPFGVVLVNKQEISDLLQVLDEHARIIDETVEATEAEVSKMHMYNSISLGLVILMIPILYFKYKDLILPWLSKK